MESRSTSASLTVEKEHDTLSGTDDSDREPKEVLALLYESMLQSEPALR